MSNLGVSIRSAEDRVTITGLKPSLAVLPSPPAIYRPYCPFRIPDRRRDDEYEDDLARFSIQ